MCLEKSHGYSLMAILIYQELHISPCETRIRRDGVEGETHVRLRRNEIWN